LLKQTLFIVYFLAFVGLFLLTLPNLVIAAQATRADLVAVYIFRLAGHIQWANSAKIQKYKIHVIDKNSDIADQLEKISSTRTLRGKPFTISRSAADKMPDGVHLVYISQAYRDSFAKLFTQAENHNILLISDNLPDKRLIMLNLLDDSNNKIGFEINKANIINQNLGVDPDIILLGGTEVDVAKLYRQGQKNLQQAQDEMKRIQGEISAIQTEKKQLLKTLDSNRIEVEHQSKRLIEARNAVKLLQKTTTTQQTQLEDQTRRLEEISNTLSKQKNTLASQEQTVAQQQSQIRQQQSKFDALQAQSRVQEINIKKQTMALENRAKQLDQQQQEIEKRSTILGEQQLRIESQTEVINEQNNTIREQETVLNERGAVIASQQNYLIMLSITVGLASILVMVIYRGNRNNKKVNLQLREQRDLLSSTARELKHAKEQAETANNAKSTFLANMSHELRTPLNAVLGFSELMARDTEATKKQRQNLDIINRSGQHLLSMIDAVLDLSKIEAGKENVTPSACNLVQTLLDICAMLRIRAGNKGLTFTLEQSAELPHYVKIDAGKLRQILINLLSNAVKFTDKGTITLWAGREADQDQPKLLFEIHDHGIGIPADKLDNIFEPFVQVDTNTATQHGTGLGLAISRQFVQLMGGEISVSSVVGQGSVFHVKLPFVESAPKEIVQSSKPRQVIGLSANEKQWKVLIVEDQLENRLLLKGLLESTGFDVKEAIDGAQGLRMFEQWRPNLIFMDIGLPLMNGDEVARRIRQLADGSHVKIIALTANLLIKKKNIIIEAGCDEVLYKPFQSFEIFDAMARLLGVHYRYEEEESSTVRLAPNLSAAALNQLPADLLLALQSAARNLDQTAFLSLLNKIDKRETNLRDGLADLANDFRFDKILLLCDKALTNVEAKV